MYYGEMICSIGRRCNFQQLTRSTIQSLVWGHPSWNKQLLQRCAPCIPAYLHSVGFVNHKTARFSQMQPKQQQQQQQLPKEKIVGKNDDTFKTSNKTVTLQSVIKDLDKSKQFNQGNGGIPNGNGLHSSNRKKWNIDFVRQTTDRYEYYLKHFYYLHKSQSNLSSSDCTSSTTVLDPSVSEEMKHIFLSSDTTKNAFVAVLRCKLPTHELSRKVREWERYIGRIGVTQMTDSLSLAILEANGKAGNVGRAIELLSLRKSRKYLPKPFEFIYAITAIDAAGLYLRRNRNIFIAEIDQPKIDDPTRWLDAILLNMNQRNFSLTTIMANQMLNTFSRTGKSAKMTHYFYRVLRKPINNFDDNDNDNDNDNDSDNDNKNDKNGNGKYRQDTFAEDGESHKIATHKNHPIKVTVDMRPPPPYHKIPSQVRGKLVKKPGSDIKQLKLERESDQVRLRLRYVACITP